ncbi:DUF433 domain-containing protein [Plantactinospora endophytica]|nr:hypothetical protein [Plantactinospora endophytica]
MPADQDRPVVVIDPALAFGRPQIKGVTTGALAGRVMGGDSVNDVVEDFGLTRREVLLACWHEGIQGEFQRQWGGWAAEVHAALGGWEPLDVDALPDPPSRDELTEQAAA